MKKYVTLNDYEDDSEIAIFIDDDYSGVLVCCADHKGGSVSMTIDSGLLKQLCNKTAEALKHRAQKSNECGEVKW